MEIREYYFDESIVEMVMECERTEEELKLEPILNRVREGVKIGDDNYTKLFLQEKMKKNPINAMFFLYLINKKIKNPYINRLALTEMNNFYPKIIVIGENYVREGRISLVGLDSEQKDLLDVINKPNLVRHIVDEKGDFVVTNKIVIRSEPEFYYKNNKLIQSFTESRLDPSSITQILKEEENENCISFKPEKKHYAVRFVSKY